MRALPGPGSRVAFYSRYSTSLQSYKSIEGQERLCAAYAEKQGWVETGRYSDAERSGTTTMGRQGLFQMLAAADRGEFQVLLMEDTDRASRDAADMHRIAKELEELDIVLCTVVGGVVTDIELAFKSVQHQQFIKQNAEKSKRGQELAVSQGRMSGSVAYGYRKVVAADAQGNPINGLREKDPDRAAIVERIHQDFDAGKTTFEICKALNAEGEPAPKGGLWRVGTLLGNRHGGIGILRNPAYVGEYHYRKTQRKRRKNKMKMRFTAESERIIVQHPELRIIPQELWDRNQARLAENYDKPFHAKRKGEFVFTGRVFCGKCGCTSIASDGKYVCTGRSQKGVCDNTRRAPRIAVEQSVFDRLQKHLLSAGLLKPCIDAYREEADRARVEHEARRQSDRSRLEDVDQRIANLVAQLGGMRDTGYASQMLAVELDRLGAEKAVLEKQSKVRHVAAVPVEDADVIADRITATLQNLQAALQGDDREAARARELLRGLVSRVVLTPTSGTPTDGRGAGDVTVTVEGRLAALIDLAAIDIKRVTKDAPRPMYGLDNATAGWRFSYVLPWRDPRLATVYGDLPLLTGLLDHADVPVTMAAFATALDTPVPVGGEEGAAQSGAQRARNAVAYLQAKGFTRCVNLKTEHTGYVWNDQGLTDEEWKARVTTPPMTKVLPPLRISPPEAVVVVVGQLGPADGDLSG